MHGPVFITTVLIRFEKPYNVNRIMYFEYIFLEHPKKDKKIWTILISIKNYNYNFTFNRSFLFSTTYTFYVKNNVILNQIILVMFGFLVLVVFHKNLKLIYDLRNEVTATINETTNIYIKHYKTILFNYFKNIFFQF